MLCSRYQSLKSTLLKSKTRTGIVASELLFSCHQTLLLIFTDLRTSGYGRLTLSHDPLTGCIISGLVLHHLRHYRDTLPIFIWSGEDYEMPEMLFALTTNVPDHRRPCSHGMGLGCSR